LNTYNGEHLLLYPNPSNNQLILDGLDETSSGMINIYNMNMQLIFNKNINTNKKTLTLNFSDLPSGIYFIEYETKDYQIMKKWVKL
jgi:hypothetical protein